MTGFLGSAYPWVKAAHVVFVIFWMAGLFILPRYLVHHQEALARADEAARWVEREAKLKRVILRPAMTLTWLLGIALALNVGLIDGTGGLGWLHAKLAVVVALSVYNDWALSYARKLARGEAPIATRRLRMLNELPALGVVLAVVFVIVRPF